MELNFNGVWESMKNCLSHRQERPNIGAPPPTIIDEDPVMQNLDEEEFVEVTSTAWMLTRWLCRQWGVPVPSTAGMSAMAAEGLAGRGQGWGGKEGLLLTDGL